MRADVMVLDGQVCVRIQAVGWVPAKPARELQVGDVVLWNFGYATEVVAIEPSKSGKTLTVTYRPSDLGRRNAWAKEHTRRHSADSLLGILKGAGQ